VPADRGALKLLWSHFGRQFQTVRVFAIGRARIGATPRSQIEAVVVDSAENAA